MNRMTGKGSLKNFFKRIDGRVKDIFLLAALALVLVFSAWQIFHTEEVTATSAVGMTETERKVMRLLEEIDGVGEANVIVYETEDGPKSVREAVAAALGTEEKAVKIYLKKE